MSAVDPAQAVAEALVAHTRLSSDGRCSCGHVVPLGHSFANHQAAQVVAAASPGIERVKERIDGEVQPARGYRADWLILDEAQNLSEPEVPP